MNCLLPVEIIRDITINHASSGTLSKSYIASTWHFIAECISKIMILLSILTCDRERLSWKRKMSTGLHPHLNISFTNENESLRKVGCSIISCIYQMLPFVTNCCRRCRMLKNIFCNFLYSLHDLHREIMTALDNT